MEVISPAKILVIDDDPLICKILKKILEREALTVDVAHTVRAGRGALATSAYQLAICDLMLPDGSGLDLIRYVRQDLPGVGTIVLTGAADFSAVVEGVRLGACSYLLKPLVPAQVTEAVREALVLRKEEERLRESNTGVPLAMLVDQDPLEIRTVNNWFSRLGFATVIAGDFGEALRMIESHSPDLILCDAVIQGGDGMDLLSEARRRLPWSPVILASSSGSMETAVSALRRGVYDILGKPFDKDSFEVAIRRAQVLVQTQKERQRLERSNEMFRQRLEKLSGDLDRRVKQSVTEITSLQRFPTMIMNSLPTGVVTTDRTLRITSTNPAAQRFLGVSGPMLEGRDIDTIPKLRPFVDNLKETLQRRIRINRQQAQIDDLDLGTITLGYGCCPLLDPDTGLAEGCLLFFTDLTCKAEVESLNLGSNQSAGLDVESLAQSIAHELNNPLTAAIGLIELMKLETDLPHDVAEKIYKISVALDRVTTVLREKVERAEVGREKRRVDIHEAIQRVLEIMELQLLDSGISTSVHLEAGDHRIDSWGRELEQVLANLVKNAKDAMVDGGKLVIATKNVDAGLMVEVRDTGMGMSPGDIPRLLQPYQTTKPVGQGTGLGLPICQAIIRRHGGLFEIQSDVGRGCTVRITLPRVQEEAIRLVRPSAAALPLPVPATCRVAVVDDEQSILDYCREALSRYGIAVTTFRSARAFLDRNDLEPYDVLISDVRMPEMSGLDLREELRRRRSRTSVFLMTGSLTALPRERIGHSGELRVLRKPFRETDLLAAVQMALTPASSPSNGVA